MTLASFRSLIVIIGIVLVVWVLVLAGSGPILSLDPDNRQSLEPVFKEFLSESAKYYKGNDRLETEFYIAWQVVEKVYKGEYRRRCEDLNGKTAIGITKFVKEKYPDAYNEVLDKFQKQYGNR